MKLAEREALYWGDVIAARDEDERADWVARSAAARAGIRRIDLRYGDHPRQAVDLFPSEHGSGSLLLFVHGGYWQGGAREDNCAPAPYWSAKGVAYGAVGYRLLADGGLEGAVSDVRAGLALVAAESRAIGIDAAKIVLVGHSAGGHLAAMTRVVDTSVPHAGLVLISGVYDLRPLAGTTPGAALASVDLTNLASGPLEARRHDAAPTLILYGADETSVFREQSRQLAETWRGGPAPVSIEAVERANHYTVLHQLERDGAVARFVHDAVTRGFEAA
jgi:arylformamidase